MNYPPNSNKKTSVRDCSDILFAASSFAAKRYSEKLDPKFDGGKRPYQRILNFLSVCMYLLPLLVFASQEEVYLKEYFDNGQVKSEGWKKGTQKIRYWKYYYADGTLKEEGHFKNGLKENYWKSYFENGRLKNEGSYSYNQKNNYWKSYFQNGKLKEEGRYVQNKKDLYWLYYFENGTIKERGFYKNNLREQFWVFFHQNKTKKEEGHYLNGLKTKWWVFYNSVGEVQKKCQFVDDKCSGYCLVYENEKLVKAEKYVNDKKVNEWTSYSSFRKENKLSDLK
ncbi:toxin-antitoxin system YwqK family antitoxin [Aureivirga marina]|uniref:toxin-antitoxin system YwqK family antitoxin n=1 Tax=Aureivirga marina TaxID=1182451 RepID=UPI0018CA00F8|nr:toxin-antitoxin system YwqK family antitoxin [Aureivirga marina]